jgi:phenylacetate-CoA ligase
VIRAFLWHRVNQRRGVFKWWRDIENFAPLSPAEQRAELGRRLLAQLKYFGAREDALPEWREASAINTSEELWQIWPQLPILSKQDLRTRFHPREMARLGIQGIASSTGGSTGEPTPFLHDAPMHAAMSAARSYAHWHMGWRPAMPLVVVWGSERDIGKHNTLRGRAGAMASNRYLVDGYALDESTIEQVLMLVRRFPEVAIYGFTSMLEFVARGVLQRGETIPPGRVKTAWNGGEMLFDHQSELFERAFGVPILNFYGGRELSTMAFQPTANAALQVLRPLLHCEIVDEQGHPVEPGQSGRLIWTSTVNRGTPFLRFEVGDIACYHSSHRDESGIHSLAELQGREAGLLKLPNGKTLNCLFWNHLFKDFPEVEQFQVAFQDNNRIELRLKGSPLAATREDELRSKLLSFLGPMPVSICWLDRIPLTSQGKLVQVVQESCGT